MKSYFRKLYPSIKKYHRKITVKDTVSMIQTTKLIPNINLFLKIFSPSNLLRKHKLKKRKRIRSSIT